MPRIRVLVARRSLPPLAVVLAVLATINLGVGVGLALTQPSRADDVWIIYDWCRAWLLRGTQLYADLDAMTDYPPNAIATLAPIALVPRSWLVPVVAMLTLVSTPLLAYVVIRSTAPRARLAVAIVPALLFFCWGGVRTLLEFSRVCLALGFGSVLLADARPGTAGVLLGLALVKPHIGGPVLLWAMFTRHTRVVVIAVLVAALGVIVYCARAHVGVVDVLIGYVRTLRSLFAGADAMIGRTSLQQWTHVVAGDGALGDAFWIVAAGVVLIAPCRLAMTARPSAQAASPALFCLWSLLAVYHIGNNLILMLPAFVFLLLVDDPETAGWRMAVAAAIQIVLMLDLPVHVYPRVADSHLGFVARDADRFAVLLAYVSVVLICRRLDASASAGRAWAHEHR